MKKVFILVFLFGVITSFAQNRVKVLDKSDLQPIGGVTVTNGPKTVMATTDASGQADLAGFTATDVLTFSHVAFQPVSLSMNDLTSAGFKVFMTENIIKLDEFVFSANRTEEKKSELPYKIEVIQNKDIAFNNPSNAAIMLEQSGNVFVQTSQLGGGSPVLRGLEANKVLLVVDGIRMNNAIYRAGHLQNSITVDPFGLSSTEIVYGPGSTLYGSDALGGVINFRTQDPVLNPAGGLRVNGNLLGRFASANLEKTGGINLNLGMKKLALLLNASYSGFDDLREGRLRSPYSDQFGLCNYYADRIDNKDTSMKNDKPWIQKNSGYSQYNVLGKLLFKPGPKSSYQLNIQYSNSSDIPRYDRLTEMKDSTTVKYAEWYYGPQSRFLASLKAEYDLNGIIFDHASVILGYQKIHEDRIQRDFGSSKKKFNLETVGVITANADFLKKLCKTDNLRYGVEFDYNDVTSEAYNTNIKTDVTTYDRATRYPDDYGHTMSIAAYLSNNWNVTKWFAFSQGLRYTYYKLDAAYTDTMVKIMNIPFDPVITEKNSSLTGYLGLTLTPGHDWKVALVGSTGFRSPNIDDITKLNVVSGSTIVVPNPDLGPEKAYNMELSVGKTFLGCVRLEGTAYYTWLRDAMVIRPIQYNGQDSIEVDGDMYQTLAPTNAGYAHIWGVQGSLLAQVTKSFSILSNLTYTEGYDETDGVPLDHIPPFYGMTSFRLELKKFKGDFYVMYNGWKRMSQYSPSGEDNEQYATSQGMPSWYTLNLKLSYQIIKNIGIEAGVENILDEHYRKFASGISAPGRNVIVALRANL